MARMGGGGIAGAGRADADPALTPLRIAFLSYRSDPKVGGQGSYLAQAATALADLGHSVDVISGPPYPELGPSVRLIRLPSLDLYAQPHNGHLALRWHHLLSWTDLGEYFGHLSGKFTEPWSFGRRAAAYLRNRRREYDVVLDNQTLCYGLLDIRASGLPVVGVIHHPVRRDLELALQNQTDKGRRWLINRWYSFLPMHEKVAPQLDNVIVVSESSQRDVIDCLKVRTDVITQIPLCIDLDLFKPHPHIVRRDNRLLAVCSADVPLKGLKFLVEAYAKLLAGHPDLELVVVGTLREGPTSELIETLGLSGRVKFLSNLSGSDLAEEYARATICVTPSLYEGFGLPAAEALGCGAAVVVTDGGALPEVVGDAGIVVPKANADALAGALAMLLADPARRARLGEAGVRRARARFSWRQAALSYEALLRRAIVQR